MGDGCFTDITFELDDGQMKAHRAILVARCDVMRAMLAGDFREAHSSVVNIGRHFLALFTNINHSNYSDCVSGRDHLYIP